MIKEYPQQAMYRVSFSIGIPRFFGLFMDKEYGEKDVVAYDPQQAMAIVLTSIQLALRMAGEMGYQVEVHAVWQIP